jgi:hypothetical protein
MRRSANANSITPPSELMRPPSNAAVIFLRRTDGNENGSRLASIMAGVAASDWEEVGFDNRISPPVQKLTLHPPANPCLAVNRMG